MNPPSLGYVILYVNDVAASLAFYEKAFGLARRFFNDDNGKAYGELETGATRLAFASVALATEHLQQPVVTAAPDKPPLGVEIALTTPDVPALFQRALKAGATREEITAVLQLASMQGVHTMCLAAPILLDELARGAHNTKDGSSQPSTTKESR